MQRRSFLQSSLVAAACTASVNPLPAADPGPQELYELRTYLLKNAKQPILDDYISQAFIPALKRFGIGPVGVFTEDSGADTQRMFVLIVHPTVESVRTLNDRLAGDAEHQKAGEAFLAAKASDPAYQRIESFLMVPFAGMPKLVSPDLAKPRIFQLRTYESHNERAGKKKIEMFNKGEIAIFKRVGLTPVFFGETILGPAMPNLTYMLVFPDDPALKAAWQQFRGDAEWNKLKSIPEYADKEIVSRITNRTLMPAPYSQI